MKIVILDAYTTNPGDVSWKEIEMLGETMVYDRTEDADMIQRSMDAEILLTNDVPITREIIEQLPKLKYIGVLATGYNIVDINAAKEHDICVTNIPNYCTHAVAQATFALILELSQRTGAHSDAVHKGKWSRSQDYCFWDYPLIELYGKTIGIIGLGRIGGQVAQIAEAFGMKILTTSKKKNLDHDFKNIETVTLEALLQRSDVVSMHCPLTDTTKGLINKETLSLMKPSVFFINVSRGGIVIEKDLAEALSKGTIAGAGLDVLSTEPPAETNEMLGVSNCIITPHIAWAPIEARSRLITIAAENIEAFLSGNPQNVVS